MANTTEKKTMKNYAQLALVIACAVLALALIIVSAFAYQWHGENKTLKTKLVTANALADTSTITSLTNSINDMDAELNELRSANAEKDAKIREYEAILTENDLMPEEEVVEE